MCEDSLLVNDETRIHCADFNRDDDPIQASIVDLTA